MLASRGFSLTEVLISLLLMTTVSLLLLKHQWQISQLFNQTLNSLLSCFQESNFLEQGIS